MPISKGEPWGATGPLPADAPIAYSDAEAARLFAAGERLVALEAGDLCRTLGGRGDVERRRGATATICEVDVGVIAGSATDRHFVAHVAARGIVWSGEAVVAMNAEWMGDWRLGPRSHPGDGVLDITTGSLGVRDRFSARSRARTGDHLPHPDLEVSRVARAAFEFGGRRRLFVDGERWERVRSFSVEVLPGALRVAV